MGIKLAVGHGIVEVSDETLVELRHGVRHCNLRDDQCQLLVSLISQAIETSGPPPCVDSAPIQNAKSPQTFKTLATVVNRLALANPITGSWILGDHSPEAMEAGLKGIAKEIGPRLFAAVIAAQHSAVDVTFMTRDHNGGTMLEIEAIVRA